MTLISSTESLNSDVDPTAKQVETSSSVDSLVSGLQKKLQILKTAQKSQQSTKTKSSEKSAESATLANNNSQKAKVEDFHEKNTKTNQAGGGGEGFQKAFKRFNSGSKNSTSLVVEKKPAEKINEDPIQIVNGKEEFYLRFDQEQLDLEYSKLKAEYEKKNNSTNSIPKVNGKEKELYLRFAAQAQDHSKLEEAAEFEHSKNTGSITQWVINLEEKVHFFKGCCKTQNPVNYSVPIIRSQIFLKSLNHSIVSFGGLI